MSSTSVDIFTLFYPNYAVSGGDSIQLSPAISFALPLTNPNTFTALSTTNGGPGTSFEGFLYLPILAATDPCNATSQKYIPKNATTINDVPADGGSYIAVAPWVSAECATTYLNAANQIQGNAGMIFYMASDINANNFTAANPQPSSSSVWQLPNNNIGSWNFPFPVYAINADDGDLVVKTSGQYSGNMTQAPNGNALAQQFGAQNYVKLYATVSNSGGSALPSLWVFLIIVLGLLGGMIGLTSLWMHFVQRHRRRDLRDAVRAGRVDLELLGVKRLRVPQDVLDKQPLLVYIGEEDGEQQQHTPPASAPASADKPTSDHEAEINTSPNGASRDGATPTSSIEIAKENSGDDGGAGAGAGEASEHDEQAYLPPVSSLPRAKLDFSQPSCPICLDDFSPGTSIIRQLPCKHVFHPACIDPVLKEYSSLCPICKGKVLPTGFCPEITNDMVRRLRGMRHMRRIEALQRGDATFVDPVADPNGAPRTVAVHSRAMALPRHIAPRRPNIQITQGAENEAALNAARGRRPNIQITPRSDVAGPGGGGQGVEMRNVAASNRMAPEGAARPAHVSRAEWARQRARGMYDGANPLEDEDGLRSAQRPAWRRALRTVFPAMS